jgi:4-hydroxy-tetrahydrodipicolinate reductase
MKRHRVIQWATGTIGRRALAAALEHPELEVVGVRVFDPKKVGVDIGTLAGRAPVGIAASGDTDALVATPADCVLHMPHACDIGELCRLLASGKNAITTCSELFFPRRIQPPEIVKQLEEACRAGNSSLYGYGSSPGFITETLPLALLQVARRLELLAIDEFADLSRRPSPKLLFDVMGMGGPMRATTRGRAEHLRRSFGPSLEALGERIGIPIERVEAETELAAAARAVEIAAGRIEAGSVAAQRTLVRAISRGETKLFFCATWYCTDALEPAWPVSATGWRVRVEGDTPFAVELPFPIPTERLAELTPGYTAHGPVNLVSAVCEARSGLITSSDLPPLRLSLA